MDATSVVETIAERVERELERVRAARPHLASRIDRAANILVAHLSCRRQRLIRVRVGRDGRARFLVSGSGGAVYVVDPVAWSCTCPDHHRRGVACKHSIACWALWRASARPAYIGVTVASVTSEAVPFGHARSGASVVSEESGPYEMRECPGCLDGRVYDGERGAWVGCDGCSGARRTLVFVYAKAGSKGSGRLRECVACRDRFTGRDLTHVGDDHPTFFEGDELCRRCAHRHGVL